MDRTSGGFAADGPALAARGEFQCSRAPVSMAPCIRFVTKVTVAYGICRPITSRCVRGVVEKWGRDGPPGPACRVSQPSSAAERGRIPQSPGDANRTAARRGAWAFRGINGCGSAVVARRWTAAIYSTVPGRRRLIAAVAVSHGDRRMRGSSSLRSDAEGHKPNPAPSEIRAGYL